MGFICTTPVAERTRLFKLINTKNGVPRASLLIAASLLLFSENPRKTPDWKKSAKILQLLLVQKCKSRWYCEIYSFFIGTTKAIDKIKYLPLQPPPLQSLRFQSLHFQSLLFSSLISNHSISNPPTSDPSLPFPGQASCNCANQKSSG